MEKDKANTQLWGRLANAQHGGKLCTLKMVAVYSGRRGRRTLLNNKIHITTMYLPGTGSIGRAHTCIAGSHRIIGIGKDLHSRYPSNYSTYI